MRKKKRKEDEQIIKFGSFSTCTNPIIHLFYPPKICIGIVLDYFWDMFMSQEKLQTMSMQNLGEGGGGQEVHYGIVQVVNCRSQAKCQLVQSSYIKRIKLFLFFAI